jgi:putative tryptophan/tyrosine transport system substrate-binding protein
MRRRAFLLGFGAAAYLSLALAQQQKVWRVAFLTSGPFGLGFDIFRRQMTALGYGKNILIEAREALGNFDRLPGFAKELVDLHPDVIVAEATPAIAAAQRATATIPIVMSPATDPVGSGFVKSFAHPGGNITGIANMFGDLTAKSLEFLHLVLPSAKYVAVLMSNNPTHAHLFDVANEAAKGIGLSAMPFVAPSPSDLDRVFVEIKKAKCDSLYVLADPFRPKIAELAATEQIPAIYQYAPFAEIGGLMSYGPDVLVIYEKAAYYVDKILKGANPADLPVEQPTRFYFTLNLKTAKTLGLTIPESVIALADKVIE